MPRDQDLKCVACGDLIDLSHLPDNCLRCGAILPAYERPRKAPWYSSSPNAAAIVIVYMFIALLTITPLGFMWFGWIPLGNLAVVFFTHVIIPIAIFRNLTDRK